jgi:predicted N-acyltransferase
MPSFTTKLYKRIREVPRKDWDALLPDNVEDYDFLAALDDSNFRDITFYYVVIYEDSHAVGATCFFVMDFQFDMALKGWLNSISKRLKKIFPGILGVKIVFCGLPMGRGILGISKNKEEVLGLIVEEMEKLAEAHKAIAIVFKDFTADCQGFLSSLEKKSFRRISSMPSMVMNIDFDNFDAYLRSLSPSSREGFKRKLKKINQGPQFDLEVAEQVSPDVSRQMYDLYKQTADAAEMGFEELPADFFGSMSRNAAKSCKFFLWRLDGKLVAFAYCYYAKDYLIDYYLGFDYEVANKYNLYLVRFWDILKWCIDNKFKTYEIGQTSYEVKRRLGFDFLPLNAYCKPVNKLFIPLLDFYCKFLAFDKRDPVFKQMNSYKVLKSGKTPKEGLCCNQA